MSILVKGMEMPKSCDECELCTCYVREDGTEENYRCVITFYPIHKFDERHEYCPLVEIPPHGDLIDRDEQIERAWRLNLSTRELIEEMLKSAPTIIESTMGQANLKTSVNKAEEGE